MTSSPLELEQFKQMIEGRRLYLWGVSRSGIGFLGALKRLGVTPHGFIDKRSDLHNSRFFGLKVFSPDQVVRQANSEIPPFIINTTTFYYHQIASECERAGFTKGKDFISYEDLCPVDYQISISYFCNLHCISCPVGNYSKMPSGGFMDIETYKQVIDKAVSENPFAGIVQLYHWGEPLLHPEIAEIISINHSRSIFTAVSSNLSLQCNLEEVIKACPAYFYISLSGSKDNYAQTHNGGNWNLVLGNMERLSRLRQRYNPEMVVELIYHVYNNTSEREYNDARELAQRLGFEFKPYLATLLPLDNIQDYLDGHQLSDEARQTQSLLSIPLDEGLKMAYEERELPCYFERCITIYWDLKVLQCGSYCRSEGNVVCDNYLEESLDKIMKKRSHSKLCDKCKASGLHRFCSVYLNNDGRQHLVLN